MKIEHWNPSVKAVAILICVIELSFQYDARLNAMVFGVSLLLVLFFSNARVKQVIAILIPAMIAAFGLFMMGLYYARGSSITDMELESISAVPYAVRAAMSTNLPAALQLSTRLLAYAGLGVLFALTTDGEYFVSSLMHQCRLSPKFAYGILAAFHLMPGMVREYRSVRTAFAVRGVKVHFLSIRPLFTMLVNSVRWSESIAMAMESKGFCGEAPRTSFFVPRVRWFDWALAALFVGGIAAGMIFLR